MHEFIPDKSFQLLGEEENRNFHKDFINCKGEYPLGETRKWETITEIKSRTKPVIDKYLNYEKIVVVAHGGVIRRFVGKGKIEHCEIFEIDYDENFECFDWV